MVSQKLLEGLEAFPKLAARFEQLLGVAQNSKDDIELADDAEGRIIMESRELNKEVLEAWAVSQAAKKSELFETRHKHARKDVKKNSSGTPRSEI